MFFLRSLVGLFSLVLFATNQAVAATASQAVPATASPMRLSQTDPFSFASLLQLFLGLALVIGVILLLAWLMRRFGGAGFSASGMKVIATLPLSARERVVLVEAGDKQLLLGVAPGRVNLLASYDEPIIESSIMQSAPFAERLKEAMARRS